MEQIMPLKPDGWPRGATSLHVYSHPKLVNHCTIIREGFRFVSRLVDDVRVLKVDLGKVGYAHGSEPKLQVRTEKCKIILLMRGRISAQVLTTAIRPIIANQPEQLADLIEDWQHWWEEETINSAP
jgi:hypothetical protein